MNLRTERLQGAWKVLFETARFFSTINYLLEFQAIPGKMNAKNSIIMMMRLKKAIGFSAIVRPHDIHVILQDYNAKHYRFCLVPFEYNL